MQRSVFRPTAGARDAGDRDQRVQAMLLDRAAAEDVQPVANLQFLDLAEMRVDGAQRAALIGVAANAEVAVDAMAHRLIEDLAFEMIAAARVGA